MKYIQYYNQTDERGITACCVSTYSVRKNGNLKDCSYIFYHPEYKTIREIPIVKKVFDEVLPLPEQVTKILDNLPEYVRWIRNNARHFACWSNFLCWLFTEGDCFYSDYDLLCLGSMEEALPKAPKIVAGFKACGKYPVFNGGLLIKNSEFDSSGAREIMLKALLEQEAYIYSQCNWAQIDEAATWYYIHQCGDEKVLYLERKYNLGLWHLKRKPRSFEDARMLHFVSHFKPWNNIKGCEKYNKLWFDMQDELLREC